MPEKSFLARLVVIGRDEESAIRADFLRLPVCAIASRVEFEPVPAITWQRPCADFTASSITW